MNDLKLEPAKDNVSTFQSNPPRLMKYLLNKKSEFVNNIIEVSTIVEPLLNRISNVFPNYTLHDINHSIRVMEYMFDFINDIEALSDLEVTILIYSAMLHDIGMYTSEDEIDLIKNNKIINNSISYTAIMKKYNNDDKIALQEYIRRSHSERSSEFIRKSLNKILILPSMPSVSFAEDIALCCESHAKDIAWLNDKSKSYNQKGIYNYNLRYISVLLRLSDILDIDSNRTPPFLYNLINPRGVSDSEWKQHFVIYNKEKIQCDKMMNKKIVLIGECDNPNIHRKILSYIDWINSEINNSNTLTETMEDKYKLNLRFPLDNKIEPKGYKISDLKLNIDYHAVTNLLMGEKIYGDKTLGLRELIQNSIDACNVRKEYEKKTKQPWDNTYNPLIQIILDKNTNNVIIRDNGTGMSLEIIKNYFLNIGVSYYKSDEFLLKDFEYSPIGNFGIGFLSCFMLSNDVLIKTRYFKDINEYTLQLNKDSQYICLSESRNPEFQGTELVLKYDEFMQVFENNIDILKIFIDKYFLTDGLDLKLIVMDEIDKSCEFKNSVEKIDTDTSTTHIIDVSKYLHGVYGQVHISLKKKLFSTTILDINTFGQNLYFDGENLHDIEEDKFDVSLVYKNNKINFIEIPIVSSSYTDDYDRYYDVLDDISETIDKLESNLDWISIFINKDIDNFPNKSSIVIGPNDYIICDCLHFDDICDYEQEYDYSTKAYCHKFNTMYDLNNNIFLHFNLAEKEQWRPSYDGRNIYLRNTYVKNSIIKILPAISSIKINSINLNIINKNIITDVSRNNLTEESANMINYAISKVIHLWMLDNIHMDNASTELLKSFVSKFYSENNVLFKI